MHLKSSVAKRWVAKRSIMVAAHKTSVSLEDEFWDGLREIARKRQMTPSELVADIDVGREHPNLSSAVRLFVLRFYRDQVSSEGSAPETLGPTNTPGRRPEI
jgi:predicted DNA-binding ribbon-helix-helix protein